MSAGSRFQPGHAAGDPAAGSYRPDGDFSAPTQTQGNAPMIFVTDMLERMALFYIVHIIYPAIRMAEIFLGRSLLDDDE
jgi:hypothetical protein